MKKGKNLFLIVFGIAFGCSLAFAIFDLAKDKVFWSLADKMSKGTLRISSSVIKRKLTTGFGNYLAGTEQLKAKNYDFSEEGFKDLVRDRNWIIDEQNRYIRWADKFINSYADNLVDET